MSDSEDNLDAIDNEEAPCKIVVRRKPSIIPFQFLEVEAVESDGEGGDVNNAEAVYEDDGEEQDMQDESMADFVVNGEEIHTDDDDVDVNENSNDTFMQHAQIRNQLNAALDAQQQAAAEEDEKQLLQLDTAGQADGADDDAYKQQLLQQLLRKSNTTNDRKQQRYFNAFSASQNNENDDGSSSNEEEDADADYVDSSEEEEEIGNTIATNNCTTSNIDENENKNKNENEKTSKSLSELSKLDFEKLLSRTLCKFALKFEQQQQQHNGDDDGCAANPFVSMAEEIALDAADDHHKSALDMQQLTAFLDDGDDEDGMRAALRLTALTEGESVLAAPTSRSGNHVKNLMRSKLDNTTLSAAGGDSGVGVDGERNTFVHEEIRLAEHTMKRAITRRMNMEQQNVAQPLSVRDSRSLKTREREQRRPSAGKSWFHLPKGKMSAENKLHFVMLKHRHMLYRSYKPTKVRDKNVPRFFQMGTVVEGPTEFYSDRMTKKNRASSWANEYMKDQSTKQWIEEKTRRAQRRIRKPGNNVWAPMKKLNTTNRYKLRKQIIKTRKKTQQNKKKY